MSDISFGKSDIWSLYAAAVKFKESWWNHNDEAVKSRICMYIYIIYIYIIYIYIYIFIYMVQTNAYLII